MLINQLAKMNLINCFLIIYYIICANCLELSNKHVCDIIKSKTNFRCEIRDKELLIQFKGYIHILKNDQYIVKIRCYQNHRLNLTNFPMLDFSEVNSLDIKGCPIENEKFLNDLKTHLNLKKIKNLTLEMQPDQSKDISAYFFQYYENIENLKLSASKNDQFFDDTFEKIKHLKSFELSLYNLNKLPLNLFTKLAHLKSLIIIEKVKEKNQKIESLKMSFKGCKSLEKILITGMNQIRLNIVFDRVIEIIEIKNNREIVEINSDAFRNSRQVRVMDLSNNFIANINSNIFECQHEMEILDLSKNKIKMIKNTFLMHNQKLKEINLSFNEIYFIEG